MKGEWRQNKLKQEGKEREGEREIWIKGCDSAREKDR